MKYILIFIIILLAASCKREALTTYNTPDNVYFNNVTADTLDFSFAYSDVSIQDTMIALPVSVTGPPSAKDRPFKVVADPASTALSGTHYELPELVIHAGQVQDTLRLHLKRAADLSTGMRKIILRMQPNEFFKTELKYRMYNTAVPDTIDLLTFSITISDILSAGPYWDGQYARYFGTFSLKKVHFMNELVQLPLDFWSVAAPTNQQRAQATYYASVTGRYLTEQAGLGNIITDEDGTPMKMGPAYQ